jgi:hypothetical protein
VSAPRKPAVPKFRRKITNRSDFTFRVPARSDRKHSLGQHADSDSHFYQVLRRWVHLAAMNEGFVYEKTATTAKNSHHYRQLDAPVRHVVQRIKAFCREKGIISEDTWGTSQWGNRVRGFYLADHAVCCQLIDGCYAFVPEYNFEARRLRFKGWSQDIVSAQLPQSSPEVAAELQPSCGEVEPKLHSLRFEVAPSVPFEVPWETAEVCGEKSDAESDGGIGCGLFGCTGRKESLESLESGQSCKSLESSESGSMGSFPSATGTEGQDPPPKPFFSDLTVTPKTPDRPNRNERPTIAKFFVIDSLEVDAMLDTLSAGLFDPKYLELEKYPHKHELKMACLYVVDRLSGEPYGGVETRAVILGHVMDRLKEKGINAPKYFPKLLRDLRSHRAVDPHTAA